MQNADARGWLEVLTELGGYHSHGINWTWAYFSTQADAEGFERWLTTNGYETRGVYPPTTSDPRFGVRFR
ncbi:MAG TPA: hypothetical protein VGE97_09675 [Nitrososphaera sp.]